MPYRLFLALSLLFSSPLFALTDSSKILRQVLENGTLSAKDCERYHAGQKDEETKLRCGKFMFFYDPMGIPGLPAGLVDLLRTNAPNNFGGSLEKFGLIADPFSEDKLPVGMVRGPSLPGKVATYSQTCANCHFGKLADGRFVAGQPNHDFDFGGLQLAVTLLPQLAVTPKKVLPMAVQDKMQPLISEFYGKDWTRLKTIAQVIKLVPSAIKLKTKPATDDQLRYLARLPNGVFDIFAYPLLDDGAAVPQRILPTWGIDPEAMVKAGAPHAMLSTAGGSPSLMNIIITAASVVDVNLGTNLKPTYTEEYAEPLMAYILSLKAPINAAPIDAARQARGKELFRSSCASCHNGPAGAGTKLFTAEEIGTDPNVTDLLDPDHTGIPLANMVEPIELTHSIRAGRLAGFWSIKRLLHNGSVQSLPELFCLDGERSENAMPGMSSAGHRYTCDLSREEKLDLIHYVEHIE